MKRHKTDPASEETLTQMYRDQASRLCWLAFLLTGDRTRGLEATIEVLNTEDAVNPFFENWVVAWSRKLLIAKALGTVRAEMRASMSRTELRHFEYSTGMDCSPLSTWSFGTGTETLQLERALLAIDLFPRCSLFLMVFEKLSLDDAAILLNTDKELVATARSIGLVVPGTLPRIKAGYPRSPVSRSHRRSKRAPNCLKVPK